MKFDERNEPLHESEPSEPDMTHVTLPSFFDVSTRASQAPKNELELFHQMAENIDEIFWVLDAANSEVIYVSPAFEKICGFPCQRLYDAPTSYRDIIHPEDRATVLARLDELRTTGRFNEEFRITRADGIVRWVAARGFLARDSKGQVGRLVGTVQDVTERRTAEQMLRESESRYRELVEFSEDLICTHDLEGRLLSVNAAPARILGYEPPELMNRPMKEFLAPAFHREFDDYLARIQKDGVASGLLAVYTRSGEKRIWRYRNTLRNDGVSKPIVRGIAHDITDLKRTEKALRTSEEKFSKAFQASPIAMAISTAGEGRFLDANESFLRQSGYAKDEILGHTDVDLNMWHEPLQRQAVIQEILTVGRVRDYEMKFRAKSGNVLQARYSVELIEIGGALCALMAAEDITEQKRVQEALRKSEEDYRSLFESAPYGVFRASPDGRFLMVNPALVRMLGYPSKSDLLLRNLATDVFADAHDHDAAMRECCKREHFENIELRWKRHDGAPILIQATGRVVRNPAGELAYCEVMVEDVTGRRLLEEQVRQSQKMEAVSLLAGGVAHDFNTLLVAILGYGERLLVSSSLPESLRKSAQEIVGAALQARSLTQQLLAMSRHQVIQPKVLNLNSVLGELQELLRNLAGENIQVSFLFDPSLGAIRADQAQLKQVLINLIANARDAISRGGTITIQTANSEVSDLASAQFPGLDPGSYVSVIVTDTGCGMDERTQSRIFEPFFTTKPEGKGIGLGLSTVYGIVDQSGGRILVASAPGKGSTFRVCFPRIEGAPQQSADVTQTDLTSAGNQTILVVEDDSVARQIACDLLEETGYTIVRARDASEAVRLSRHYIGRIHLLLTDIVLPGKCGQELARQLVLSRPGMKVLYMTSYSDSVLSSSGGAEPEPEVLQKPFLRAELLAKVRQVLGAGGEELTLPC